MENILIVIDSYKLNKNTILIIECPSWLSSLPIEQVVGKQFTFFKDNIIQTHLVKGIERYAIHREKLLANVNEKIGIYIDK